MGWKKIRGAVVGGALGGGSGPLGVAVGAGLGYLYNRQNELAKRVGGSYDASGNYVPPPLTSSSLFSSLSPTEQKDLLLNNPTIETPQGTQYYDTATNTIKLNESDYTKAQRLQQERISQELASSLSGNLPGVDDQAVQDATFQLGKRQLDPVLAQQKKDLAQQLANQGIPMGSEAYNTEMNRFERSQGDQLNALSLQSLLSGQQMAETKRAARFNEISSLLGRSQVGAGTSFQQYQPSFNGIDLTGNQLQREGFDLQNRMSIRQASAQKQAAIWGAAGNVIGAGIKGAAA